MLRYLPIIAILGLMIYSFIDVLLTHSRRFRTLGKVAWLLVTLIPLLGAILWLFVGRPRRHPHGSWSDQVIHLRRSERTVAPDDDPAFLRVLDERAWRAQREAKRRQQEAAGQPDEGGAGAADELSAPADDPDGPDDPGSDGSLGPSAGDSGEIPPKPRLGD